MRSACGAVIRDRARLLPSLGADRDFLESVELSVPVAPLQHRNRYNARFQREAYDVRSFAG